MYTINKLTSRIFIAEMFHKMCHEFLLLLYRLPRDIDINK